MHFSQVAVILAAVFGYVFATGYGGSGSGGYGGGASGFGTSGGYGGGGGGAGGYSGGSNLPPQPYSFDYQAQDEQGNVHFRQEQGDQSGSVKGSYGYTDVKGLKRVVEYVADAAGFRANIQTNEPGVGEDSPADVVLIAQPPPAGIQDSFNRAGGGGFSGSYSGGAGGSFGGGAGGSFGSGSGGPPPRIPPKPSGGAGVRSGKSGY